MRRALRSGGRFGFSVEEGDEGDFALQPTTLRYAYSLAYLTRLADQSDWTVTTVQPHAVRRAAQRSIAGYNIVMRCC